MRNSELTKKTALEVSGLIERREISPVELLDACLERIAKQNPTFNAIITLAEGSMYELAVQAEKDIGQGRYKGPLHGIPFVVKDVTETAGLRTTYASPMYKDNIPDVDAEVVRRLKVAGAIVLGKTNTPEFATGANTVNTVFGATLNPWNKALSAAGSSGGSAVAVASGMVPLGHGTDFGASLRMPAAFCGIVGLRTTPGLIPNDPMPLPWDAGQVHGPLARTAEDAALMLDAMTGFDQIWPISIEPNWDSALDIVLKTNDVKGLRIAYAPDIAGIGIEPEIAERVEAAAMSLESNGADIEKLNFDLSEGCAAYLALRAEWMVGQQYSRLDLLSEMDANLAGNLREGLALTLRDTMKAQAVRQKLLGDYRQLFERFDFLLTPISPVLPFPVVQNYPEEINGRKLESYADWMAPAFLVTLCGMVGGSVPIGLSNSGLPIAMQIVGPRLSEPRVLALAKHFQKAFPIGWPTEVLGIDAEKIT